LADRVVHYSEIISSMKWKWIPFGRITFLIVVEEK
jgi:protein involved in temperature-dependent protein secretion